VINKRARAVVVLAGLSRTAQEVIIRKISGKCRANDVFYNPDYIGDNPPYNEHEKRSVYIYPFSLITRPGATPCPARMHHPGRQDRAGWRTRVKRRRKTFQLIYGEVFLPVRQSHREETVFHFFPGSRWLSSGAWDATSPAGPGMPELDNCAHWKEGSMTTAYISPWKAVSQGKDWRPHALGQSPGPSTNPRSRFEYTLDSAKSLNHEGLYTQLCNERYITKKKK